MWKFLGLESDRKFKHVIFHLKQNTFGRSAQRSTALMGGNYAAPPGNAALSRIPRGISGPFKKGNAVLRSHPPRWRINLYTASGNQAKEPSPKHIEGSKRRRIRQPLFYTYTRFQIRDAFKRAIFPPRIRENLGRRRGEEEEGEGLGLGSGNQTAIAIFISARYLRWFWSAPIFFFSPIECCGESESSGWTIATIIPRHTVSPRNTFRQRGCSFEEEEKKRTNRVIANHNGE